MGPTQWLASTWTLCSRLAFTNPPHGPQSNLTNLLFIHSLLFFSTPSSSSVIGHGPSAVGHGHHQIPSWATPNFPAVHNPNPPPFLGGLFPSGNVPPSTGQCECLAQPILSSSSLMNGAAALGDTRCHSLEQDEVKIFRNGQHTDSSFSGQSSRPSN